MSALDDLLGDDEQDQPARSRRGVRGRLRARFGRLFSLRTFLLALALATGGLLLARFVPFLPAGVGALLGVFVGTFLLGLTRARRAYTEAAVAGTGVAVVATLLDYLVLSMVSGAGTEVALLSGGGGLLTGVLGHYFGRDLRAGLTRDL